MSNAAEEIWDKCLKIIKKYAQTSAYESWFKPLQAVNFEDSTLYLRVPSQYFIETLEGQHKGILQEAVQSVIGSNAKVVYKYYMLEAETIEQSNLETNRLPINGYNVKEELTFDPFKQRRINVAPQLNENYTFDNYVPGECNKMARALAIEVANKPGLTPFNPLYIYGASGVGKTHLIQAIGLEICKRDSELCVIYLAASNFMRQMMQAAKDGKTYEFIEFYQGVDILIIDDIQEIAGKTGTENAFFQIFNHLKEHNKQIVIASDKKPHEIIGMEDRLLSRLKSGIVEEITRPDFETRTRIIKAKISHIGIQLSNEIISYLADNLHNNVRELEGSISSLMARATVMHCDITMSVAKAVVENMINTPSREVSIDQIIDTVCAFYKVDSSDLRKKSRKQEFVWPRQVCMYLAKNMTNASLATIGLNIANRNHSTVLYALKTVQDRISVDKEVEKEIKQIESKVRNC
ncbi:MAG: chromosomal replication initiator protein DnaA [Marinilabiliaceae bacterium]|nr:chromosomal replication initiator protein DnaA [Marinilabiliaceae bacterium]